jgi:hypothetical protein
MTLQYDLTKIPRAKAEQPAPFAREPLLQGNAFTRLITAKVLAQLQRRTVESVIADQWPHDRIMDMVARAASAPAITTVPGWAQELAHKVVLDGVAALRPASGAAQLMPNCLVLRFDGAGQISVPGFVANVANAGFVQEGNPIPVRQLSAAAAVLSPYKLGTIATLTQEMAESSNAEAMIGDSLFKSAGLALDAVMFDANPATAARPAGLLNGITALTASSSTDPFGAVFEDISTLINAISTVGGAGPYYIITSPGKVISGQARLSAGSYDVIKFIGSNIIGNTMIAVAPQALVVAFDPNPEIDVSNAATLVMDDTAPALPDTTQPTKSLFQTATLAVKMRWPVSWSLRDSRGVAWLTPGWK